MPPYLSILNATGSGGSSAPTTAPSFSPIGPSYQDILKQVRQPVNYAAPQAGTDQRYADIETQRQLAAKDLTGRAITLAAQRGITGSSTEQFGVAQAGEQANKAAIDARNQIATDQFNAENQRQAVLAGIQGNQNAQAGQLTSDEIASLRNQTFAQQYLALQQQLGQQGIDVANRNIDAQRDIGNQQGKNSLLQSIIGGGTNLLGAGILSGHNPLSLFTAGGGTLSGGSLTGVPLAGEAGAGSSLFPAGVAAPGGSVGTAGAGAGGASFGAGALIPAGLGAMYIAKQGEKHGGTVGSVLANPIGAQLNVVKGAISQPGNAVKNTVNSVTKAISSIPF